MRSVPRGGVTLVEVSGISPHGLWLFLGDREAFLSFERFPWFRDAPVSGVLNVERPQPHHLYWPDLDIDLSVESIFHPERYPLVSRERTENRAKPKRHTAPTRRKTGQRRRP